MRRYWAIDGGRPPKLVVLSSHRCEWYPNFRWCQNMVAAGVVVSYQWQEWKGQSLLKRWWAKNGLICVQNLSRLVWSDLASWEQRQATRTLEILAWPLSIGLEQSINYVIRKSSSKSIHRLSSWWQQEGLATYLYLFLWPLHWQITARTINS